jgi:uncharacterized protein YndB with AHSA1/START domain
MTTKIAEQGIQTIQILKEIAIKAPPEIAFDALLEQLGPSSEMMGGKPMPMVFEAWPGGRWYRDLGKNSGHFWGHVQVIKPPTLLEVCGPLFMSYPAANHVQYRLIADDNGTRLSLTHRGFGHIPDEVMENVGQGWEYILSRVSENAERLKRSRS